MRPEFWTKDWWFDSVFNCLLIPVLASVPLVYAGILPENKWGPLSIIAVTIWVRLSILDRGLA